MNFLPLLLLVGAAMVLRRKRECSAELCTCGCTDADFDYAPKSKEAPQEASPEVMRYVPRIMAAPTAVAPILAPYVPPGQGSGGSDTGGASGGGSGSGGTNGGSSGGGTGTGGGGGGIVCFPEMCQPTWGNGVDWFDRYGLSEFREACCGH